MTVGSSHTLRPRALGLALLAIMGVSLTTARPIAATASGPAAIGQAPDEPVDCLGAIQEAAPGTRDWDELNAANAYCTRERDQDKPAHAVLDRTAPADAYREPSRHAGVRFRYDTTTIGGLHAEIYRPCTAGTCPDPPTGLETFDPPYPAVVVFHGGAANSSLYWWASQPLAEAGYLVVAFDSPAGPTLDDASTIVDWLHSDDPLAADYDGQRSGIAGHSRGGVVVSEFGQRDRRVSAVVSWDRAQSTPLPPDLPFDTPTDGCTAPHGAAPAPRDEAPTASDTGSSSSVATIVAIAVAVAVAVVLLLAGGLLAAHRRSTRDTAEPSRRPSGPVSRPPGTDR